MGDVTHSDLPQIHRELWRWTRKQHIRVAQTLLWHFIWSKAAFLIVWCTISCLPLRRSIKIAIFGQTTLELECGVVQ